MKISVNELNDRLTRGEVDYLVDVRTREEFHSERPDIDLLRHHDLADIENLDLPKDAAIHLTCRSGHRSAEAQEKLRARGFSNVVNVDGGMLAWRAAGLPMTKTSGVIPIIRQVHLVAGLLILTGALGSLFWTPALAWLAAFVGAGLTFAGLTGFCGMAILLGRMPWNRAMQREI